MPLPIDPEVLLALQPQIDAAAEREPVPIGDVKQRRIGATEFFQWAVSTKSTIDGPAVDQVNVAHHTLTTKDGAELALAWYTPAKSEGRAKSEMSGSAVLYLHGGGMIFSLAETGPFYDWVARFLVAGTGVPILTVDYRVAPEHPHPTPVEDCYAALLWLAEQAHNLGVDPDRIGVAGDSAGGGLAAGVSLLARDRGGPKLALQLLIYPMLDDRTRIPSSELTPEYLTWSYADNVTGWDALLGRDADAISEYAAPARAADLTGLPPAFIDCGDLDIFRAEDVEYARRLAAAGVPTELHIYPGCPHGFETVAPEAGVSQRAIAERIRRIQAI